MILFKVYRDGEYLDTVNAEDESKAIEEATYRWGAKTFGDEGARTPKDVELYDNFLHAIFTTEDLTNEK